MAIDLLETDEAAHWLGRLRASRGKALADAEGFDAILFTVEAMGRFLSGRPLSGLAACKIPLAKLIRAGVAAGRIQEETIERFDRLFEMARNVRNDAMHEGAYARHATSVCVELALIIEEALVAKASTIGEYMIASPIEAKLFESVGAVRRTMLMNSFSFLPIRNLSGAWKLVSDVELTKHLSVPSNSERLRRLAEPMKDSGIALHDAVLVQPHTSVSSVIKDLDARPLLVTREINGQTELLGLVSAFDLL